MSNISYLIPALRLELWDVNPAEYRYTDEWLDVALVTAVKALQRWWADRYVVDETGLVVSRGATASFDFAEPPVIEHSDEMPVVLMAAFLIKGGVMESNSWSTSTWRDAEYYVSNVEGGKMKESSLQRTWDRLLTYITPPTKRLSAGARLSMDFGADETT